MDEVSAKAILLIKEICEKEGRSFSSLLEGVRIDEDRLNEENYRVDWNEYRKFMKNVGQVWNDKQLEEFGKSFVHAKALKRFRTTFQIFLSPHDFYKWMYSSRSPGRQYFTCIFSTYADLGKNRFLGILQMEKGYKRCREYYFITKGFMQELSAIIGFPSSKVEMNLVDNGAYYYITFLEGIKFLSLLRYIIRWPINIWLAKKELREALESLQEAYVEIVHAKNNLEMRVEERTAELKQAQAARENIFANISHEFRTPLTLIQGPLERLFAEETDKKKRDQFSMILKNTERVLMLVNQLLDISKIEAGRMDLHASEMNLSDVIKSIGGSFESYAQQKKINFFIDIPEDPVIGWFDRDFVEKILINLLSNAFKFTSEGGKVNLHLVRMEESAEITVADTGVGISPEEIDKIFDRFYQIDASHTREVEGSGIGLSLTKELVELHYGEISVSSRPGEGTSFKVNLPLGRAHLKPDQTLSYANKPIDYPATLIEKSNRFDIEEDFRDNGLAPLVLIIEDNPDMRKYIRTYLDIEYKVIEADNGGEGIEKAVETIPDLIISDVMMPKMNGYEVCRKLKADERTSHIPVILLTAKASIDSKLEGLETGADSYLTKPFNSKELLTRIKNLIEQRKKLQEKFSRGGIFHLPIREEELISPDKKFIQKIMEIAEKYLSEEEFTIEQFAAEAAMSRVQLHRKLKALTGKSPSRFLRSYRLLAAKQMLAENTGNISETAYSVGFSSPIYFSKCFKEEFGFPPSELQ